MQMLTAQSMLGPNATVASFLAPQDFLLVAALTKGNQICNKSPKFPTENFWHMHQLQMMMWPGSTNQISSRN